MSYYANVEDLMSWLDEINFAPITKNKVRKESLESLRSLLTLKPRPGDFKLPPHHLTTLKSFLQKDGKGTTLTDDELLSFNTSVSYLLKTLEIYKTKHSVHSMPTSRVESPEDNVENKNQLSPSFGARSIPRNPQNLPKEVED